MALNHIVSSLYTLNTSADCEFIFGSQCEKTGLQGFQSRLDTNQAVESQMIFRDFLFQI